MATRRDRTRSGHQSAPASPASDLPTELIVHILKLAVEEIEETQPFEAQLVRVRMGKVCRQWYMVALPLRSYVVRSSVRARQLVGLLEDVEAEARPTSLDITTEDFGGVDCGKKIAELLLECSSVKHLRLELKASLVDASSGYRAAGDLGPDVLRALYKLTSLERFHLYGSIFLPPSTWIKSLGSWSKLSDLRVPSEFGEVMRDPRNLWLDSSACAHLPALRKLSFASDSLGHAIDALLRASLGTVNAVHLSNAVLETRARSWGRVLEPILHQLVEFQLLDPARPQASLVGYFTPFIEQMHSVQVLDIGANLVAFTHLFERTVPSLSSLRHLTIVCKADGINAAELERRYQMLPSELVLTFFAQSPRIRSISITGPLLKPWTLKEHELVGKAAENAGVSWKVDR